ncbi:family 1 glycosylhydrolase [Bdellovibrio sp. BCCA]|uniref:family 1 glycosylhydrolase n=1 Tax=Bdellovibrio sp. BCCA TaxID=3136281 RepID=UPI0030EFAFA3
MDFLSVEPLKLWIGVECTLNRVQDTYYSQIEKSGHSRRMTDLHLFSSLGAERIRYPFLWEQLCPAERPSWEWSDARMDELKKLNLIPIAGFLHHGSGPSHTQLTHVDFPQKFAEYAAAFAKRYPSVQDYTPINEILTTARFSCLYGHWYPHKKNDADFIRAVFNQCKATVLAMNEIKSVNSQARLIQTEDLGKAQSTAPLKYQSDFENERRWLSFDFLTGKVDRGHSLYDYLLLELKEEEISWMQDHHCGIDVLGLNHYHLSNRFLDHRLNLYPPLFHGGNGRDLYADVGAIDTGQVAPPSVESILLEAWNRYERPMAVTEVHCRGFRESQLRWFNEVWQSAKNLRAQQIPIQAVTAWSLLGSFDWNELCTKDNYFYEPGVFDLRSADGNPRKTLLTDMLESCAQEKSFGHPLLEQKGVWNTPARILYAPNEIFTPLDPVKGRPILITGGGGTLSRAFARICARRNIPFRLLSRAQLDITRRDHVLKILTEFNPWAVINTAGYVKVDEAESDVERCFRENVHGPEILALECLEKNIQLMTFSSDLVFDGESENPYLESHEARPLNIYGYSKAVAEQKVLSLNQEALVIRTSAFFGPWDEYNFITSCLRALQQKQYFLAAQDVRISPTYIPDLANVSLDLLMDKEKGLVHLVNDGDVSWSEFALLAVQRTEPFKKHLVVPCPLADLNKPARRPYNSVLKSERYHRLLPSIEEGLEKYFRELEVSI